MASLAGRDGARRKRVARAAQARGARGASAWRARRKLYRNQGFARDARVGADLCAQAWQLFQRSESLEGNQREPGLGANWQATRGVNRCSASRPRGWRGAEKHLTY